MSLFRPLLRPARGARACRRWASVAALAVAVATPAVARVPFAQAAPSDPAPAFASSFETGQRPLDWTSTVEVGRDGAPKASGVTGPATTGIPGDITSQVSGVTASSDNPPRGDGGQGGRRRRQQQVAGLPPDRVAQPDLPEGHDGQALRPGLGQRRPERDPGRLAAV